MKNSKITKVFHVLLVVAFSIGFFLLSGFASIMIPATSRNFYKSQFIKYDTVEWVREQGVYLDDRNAREYIENITESQLLDLMDHTMLYCLGFADDLNITVDGVRLEVFREDEYAHMRDCRALFIGGEIIGGVALLLVIAGLVFVLLFSGEYYKNARKVPFLAIGVCALAVAVVGVVALIDFDAAFTAFHRILFTGNWTFANGVMISMIGTIFTDLVVYIAIGWLGSIALFVLVFAFINSYLARRGAFPFSLNSSRRKLKASLSSSAPAQNPDFKDGEDGIGLQNGEK
jgi:uncharacterized membrane protein